MKSPDESRPPGYEAAADWRAPGVLKSLPVRCSREGGGVRPIFASSTAAFASQRDNKLAYPKSVWPGRERVSSRCPGTNVPSGAGFPSVVLQVFHRRIPNLACAGRSASDVTGPRSSSRRFGHRGCVFALAILLALLRTMHAQETRTYAGVATNITVGQAARFALNFTIVGQTITATMTTEAPLAGRATLRGGVTNGLCKLSGDAAEGFRVDFSGTLDARQYGGTYVVTFPGRVQYGTFQTTRQDPPPPLPAPNAPPALTNAAAAFTAARATPAWVNVKGRFRAGLFNRPSTDGLQVGFAQPGTRLKVLETLTVSGVTWHRVQGQDGTVLTDQGRIVKDGWIRGTMVEPAP